MAKTAALFCERLDATIKPERMETHVAKCPARHVRFQKCARPSLEKLEQWHSQCESRALDGCVVEPDSHCAHGLPSWLLRLGYVQVTIKGVRREQQRQKRRYGMRVDGAAVKRVQMALAERQSRA